MLPHKTLANGILQSSCSSDPVIYLKINLSILADDCPKVFETRDLLQLLSYQPDRVLYWIS
jgi:hypothetical protein